MVSPRNKITNSFPVSSKQSAVLTIPPNTKSVYLSDEEHFTGNYVIHSKIGRLNDMTDIVDVLNTLTKGELNIFTIFKCNMNWSNNITVVKRQQLNNKEQRQLSNGYAALHTAGLIKRVRNNTYMISPYFFLPTAEETKLQKIRDTWDSLP